MTARAHVTAVTPASSVRLVSALHHLLLEAMTQCLYICVLQGNVLQYIVIVFCDSLQWRFTQGHNNCV